MTPELTDQEKNRFINEVNALQEALENILQFSKNNLVLFNGIDTENYSYHFLQIFIRFRVNCEGLINLMQAFIEDYRLKVCVNLLLRSICSDVLTTTYLLTFYDTNDPENISLKNELDVISVEYLRSVKKMLEEDHELSETLGIKTNNTIEEKRDWFKNIASELLNEDDNLKSRNQLRSTTRKEIKIGLKTNGSFISEDEKFQRIKEKGYSHFGCSFTNFKYYSQFQHFSPVSQKVIENKPFHDTFYMSQTLDQMLMTIDLILQIAKSPNQNFRTEIDIIRKKLAEKFI